MTYVEKVLSVEPASLIGYWPLDDGAGQTCRELTGNAAPGAGHNLAWGDVGKDGTPAVTLNGANAYIDIYSAALAAAFSGEHGTISAWFKLPDLAAWGEAGRCIIALMTNDFSRRAIMEITTPPGVVRYQYKGSATKTLNSAAHQTLNWQHVVLAWDKTAGYINPYRNDVLQLPVGAGGMSIWQPQAGNMIIGGYSAAGNLFRGSLQQVSIWSKLLTTNQLEYLGGNMATLVGFNNISIQDYDGETGKLGFAVAPRTAENWAAQEILRGDFNIALQAIILGLRQREQVGNAIVTSIESCDVKAAQRELKWLVSYHDATTLKRYSVEVPTADTSVLDENDRAHAAIGDAGVVDAFVAAFEAYAITPDGNAPVIDEITLVGRNV